MTDVGDGNEGEDWDRERKSCGSNWKQPEAVISWPARARQAIRPAALNIAQDRGHQVRSRESNIVNILHSHRSPHR